MKLKTIFLLLLFYIFALQGMLAKTSKSNIKYANSGSQRVILVTIDGYRWQELFGGADSSLIFNQKYVNDLTQFRKLFWRPTAKERCMALMPFTWNFIAKHGILIGDRYVGSRMQVSNKMQFSYPGYSEDLCGYPDDERITSNNKIENPNINVLEVANNMPEYHGKVLAFGSWDVFPYILSEQRNHLEVNAGFRHSLSTHPTAREKFLDELEDETPSPWSDERLDVFTFQYALESMKSRHPKFIFIGLGETDDFGHAGKYDQYLMSAHRADDFICRLWNYVQRDSFYRNKTTLIITCDHGRGEGSNWRSHGSNIPNSGETWLMALGKNIPVKGVVTDPTIYYNKQIAPTIARILGVDFHPDHNDVGTPINF